MNIEQVRDFTLSLHGVTEDQPFGDDNITFRVEGKIFLCLWLGDGKYDVCSSASRFACKLLPTATRSSATVTAPSLLPSIGTRNTGATCITNCSTPTSSQR